MSTSMPSQNRVSWDLLRWSCVIILASLSVYFFRMAIRMRAKTVFLSTIATLYLTQFSMSHLANCITKQISACNEDETTKNRIKMIDNSPYHLLGSFEGPQGSVYEDGHFEVDIFIPNEFPFKPPEVQFITKVYHPNISASGTVCLDILEDEWSPLITLRTILLSLQSFLCDPNPHDPVDREVANQYITVREGFENTARSWTRRYAKKPARS